MKKFGYVVLLALLWVLRPIIIKLITRKLIERRFWSTKMVLGPVNPRKLKLNEWPMIMAHDAATAYLHGNSEQVLFSKTQEDGGFEKMLGCGTRAFDIRAGPLSSSGDVLTHHGPVVIYKKLTHIIDEVLYWSKKQEKAPENIVFLGIGEARELLPQIRKILSHRNIPFIEDCIVYKDLTIGKIMKMDSHVIATYECWEQNYDLNVTCTGFLPSNLRTISNFEYSCYDDDPNKSIPWKRMNNYIQQVVAKGLPKDGRPSTLQAIWQETPESVIVSGTKGSSLIDDEIRSNLNRKISEMIDNGSLDAHRVSVIEMNNVCNYGQEVLRAFRKKKGIHL